MALTPKLEIKTSQSLQMTPQLRQAINLLQLSNLELNELVEAELAANPLLEREDDRLADAEIAPDAINTVNNDLPLSSAETIDTDYDNQFDDSLSDREGYEQAEDYSWEDYNRRKGAASEDFDFFEQKLAAAPSLYRHLEQQIDLHFKTPRDRLIARALSEHLDAAGYFRGQTAETATRLNVPEALVEQVLQQMKNFEPSGIFAQNLSECLTIQLRDQNRYDPQIAVLLDHLDLLAQKDFKTLKKLCQAGDEDLASMIGDIRALNPKPAAAFEHDLTAYVIPDVFVRTNAYGEYLLELNNMSLPRVLINRRYYAEVKDAAAQDKNASRYLREQMGAANFLVKALHQRAVTILRVSEEIVKAQRDFFEYGAEHLKPLSLKDIAEKIEMHESTVSRVTNRKYMHTPRGTFELKYFFSAAAGTYTGAEDVSTQAIKHKIRQLINAETPDDVLSDDKLVELLAREGIKIARRTVAKYREALDIPTSAARKRQKRSPL